MVNYIGTKVFTTTFDVFHVCSKDRILGEIYYDWFIGLLPDKFDNVGVETELIPLQMFNLVLMLHEMEGKHYCTFKHFVGDWVDLLEKDLLRKLQLVPFLFEFFYSVSQVRCEISPINRFL